MKSDHPPPSLVMSQYICFDCPSPVGSTEYTPSSQVRFAAEEELGEVVALETLQRGPSKMLLQDRAGQPVLNPTSQFCSVQVLEPAGDHSPGGQRLHVAELDAPNTSLLKFWRHKVQDEDPVAGAYEPGLHGLHLVCPVFWVISPAAQGVQGATEVIENVPAAQPVTQLVDAVEPGAEVNGGAHWLHWDAFAGDH